MQFTERRSRGKGSEPGCPDPRWRRRAGVSNVLRKVNIKSRTKGSLPTLISFLISPPPSPFWLPRDGVRRNLLPEGPNRELTISKNRCEMVQSQGARGGGPAHTLPLSIPEVPFVC